MIKQSKCYLCKNYIAITDDVIPKCKAFPEGIPLEIFRGEVDHSTPYDGDNDIQFETDVSK